MKELSSHIVKVLLSCKRKYHTKSIEEVRPCVTFRIAGSVLPLSSVIGAKGEDGSDGGRPSNYVIIGLSIGLLGLMYVVAVFIFISVRKRRLQARKMVVLEAKMKSMEKSTAEPKERVRQV